MQLKTAPIDSESTRSGKSFLIRLRISTLHIEIANPSIAVPTNNPILPDEERKTIPSVSNTTAQNNTGLVPNLHASTGAKGENKANANNGRVVIMPANVFEMCKLSRIRLTKVQLMLRVLLN